ncbi:MAG: pyridoxine 5'-phosphate synthase [Candidatus Omnitrophica bacterium]|nr:pyridoxine 5'-phosphate synthase [Candidatus Omnitrophota bacterium]
MELGVNIDHIATLRQVRGGIEPEPVMAALICESSGADSIVVHLREDRRHIKERDLFLLRKVIRTKLNLEMSIAPDILKIACQAHPDQATLVPERRQELTTEGGLDVVKNFGRIKEAVKKLKQNGIPVSLFIDPDKKQIAAALKIGVRMIELHTGRYAQAKNALQQNKYFKELKDAAHFSKQKGLRVFAGHGLDYHNVSAIAGIKGIEELNIGYSIVCRAAIAGLETAVRQMRELIDRK